MKTTLQKLGKSLSAMVMPNIGAFIAWGFITALFIADGWLPNEQLASIQPYMLTYLLPVLIAATGGRMAGGDRGLVMGSIAIIGCIAGVGGTQGQPMLMAAMVMGPFSGWAIKKFDQMMDGHMPAGFEMLINNFSVGILGMLIAILGYYIIGPFMTGVLTVLTYGVDILVNKGLIPLVAIFIFTLLALASLSEGFERKQQNHLLCGWCQKMLYKIITILSIMKVFKLSK